MSPPPRLTPARRVRPQSAQRAWRRRPALAILLLVAGAAPLGAADRDFSQPDVAVEAGRDALDSAWNVPWYDSEHDDFSPVQLRKPRQPSPFWEWLGGLFQGWNLDLGNVLQFIGWLVVAGLIIWLIVAMIRGYQQLEFAQAAEASQRYADQTHVERIEALPIAFDAPDGDYLNAARRAYESGDLTAAVVYLFSYELLELDRRSLLRLVKGKTNRQYLRELRGQEPPAGRLAAILARTVRLFEAAFFGAHPPSRDAFDQCWDEATEFQRLLSPAEEGV